MHSEGFLHGNTLHWLMLMRLSSRLQVVTVVAQVVEMLRQSKRSRPADSSTPGGHVSQQLVTDRSINRFKHRFSHMPIYACSMTWDTQLALFTSEQYL